MLQTATLLLIAYALWCGAPALGVALLVAGFLVQLALTLRLLRASLGGVGGHAEWVREVSTRPRLARSPAWLLALALVLSGLAVTLLG